MSKQDIKDLVGGLIAVLVIALLIVFFYRNSATEDNYPKIVKDHFNKCVQALRSDYPEYNDYQYTEVDALYPEECFIKVAKYTKGWTKENTYWPDEVDYSTIKRVRFYLK